MTTPFISFAQNGEDVILNRALADVETGRYVDVGANHPLIDSVTRSFYDRGWAGVAIEPNPSFASMYRSERPRDTVIEAAVTDTPDATATFHVIDGTGLSTLVDSISAEHVKGGYGVSDLTVPTIRLDAAIEQSGIGGSDVHFLVVDAEGAEERVLRSLDFMKYRPWILVIEATSPGTTTASHSSWEPLVLAAGYEFCLFDGLSRYYVSKERSAQLKAALSYPACVFDNFITQREQRARTELDAARTDIAMLSQRVAELQDLVAAVKRTLSWRVTAPLRWVRGIGRH
ncbi:FkbM family methyltransferase [Parafrigoribacterium mesophilum]|uniref:FkbM family methyltransferase n=1 Tax=Parafrigoribacterium mesophilum TaxID=433646 RepID=UPI0031FCB742